MTGIRQIINMVHFKVQLLCSYINILLATRGQQREGTFKVLHHWILTFSFYRHLGDTAGLAPDHHSKASQMNFLFPRA